MDNLGIGGAEYIGKPKQPTIKICTLVEDEYQKQLCENLLISSVVVRVTTREPTKLGRSVLLTSLYE